ncbi:MAG: bactofilin family protein [Bacteroidales bacterium]
MLRREEKQSGLPHNALANGTYIKGNINAQEDFRIDGNIDGDVSCNGKVVIGPHAVITGNVSCIHADVLGTINGNIELKESLIIRKTGKINGDITTKSLAVEPDAIFSGRCIMGK